MSIYGARSMQRRRALAWAPALVLLGLAREARSQSVQCPKNAQLPGGATQWPSCACNAGFTNTSGLVNLARACSAGACTVTGISQMPDYYQMWLYHLTDGNIDSIAHTWSNTNDWMMVDLQQSAFVNHVRIFNRPDYGSGCCAQRLNNFQIRVGDSSTFSNNPACVTGDVKNFTCLLTGRYVSIQQFNTEVMNLRELQIYGLKTSNLARACSAGGCPVTIPGSIWDIFPPSHLVDGNVGTFHHTLVGANDWSLIDLQQMVFIAMVRIYNRQDCCAGNFNNFEIRVGDSSTFSNNPACASNQPTFSGSKDFICVLSGRYVSIQQFNGAAQHLGEVEVYGLKASEWCAACFAGTFKTATGSAACADCAAGKYQDAAVVTTNPPEASRTYESVWENGAPGSTFARSMLDSAQAWSWTGALPEWMQIDLGSQFRVQGVVTQCRANYEQCPHEIEVQYSRTASDFVSATAVGGTTRFFLPTTWSSTRKTSSIFSQPVTARYIRIVVYAGSSFRAGVLTLSRGDESNPQCTTRSSLVAYYSFDDSSDVGKDSNPSATKYHLTPTIVGGTGGYDAALNVRGGSFKATNDGDWLDGSFPIKTIYDNSVSGISVSVWFYKKSGTTYGNIYFTRLFQFYKPGTVLEFDVTLGHNNGIHCLNWATTYSTGQTYSSCWDQYQTLDTWHHVVVSLSKTGIFKAYVNGVNLNLVPGSAQAAIIAYGGSVYPVPQFADVNKLRIFISDDAKFSGNVDEFSVFNKELSQSEVTELYDGCQLGGAGTTWNTCADCGAGKYSTATSATVSATCVDCVTGKFSPTAASFCADCAAGKYQNAVVIITNPPEASRTYESVWDNGAPGSTYARSMLDSAAAWNIGIGATVPEWMQIDLGSEFRIHGVVTQCRANDPQCPYQIEAQYSLNTSNFVSATTVSGTTRFFLPLEYSSTLKTLSNFSQPVRARYVRIVIHDGGGMRAGVLTSLPDASWNVCADCGAGKYSTATGATVASSCQSCPANSLSATGSDAATDCVCSAGFSGPDGGTCNACAAGSFKNVTGSMACTFCAVNMYSTTVAAVSAASCVACPGNSTSVAGSGSLDLCYCNAGYRQTPTHDSCIVCTPGHYDNITNRYECSKCGGGLYSEAFGATGSETCKACRPGTWSEIGSPTCQLCPANSNSSAASGFLTDCKCNPGFTAPDGATCVACVQGKYKTSSGSAECTLCLANSVSPSASIHPSACVCLPNFNMSADRGTCARVCAAGFEAGGNNMTECVGCRPGFYKTFESDRNCTACPANAFSLSSSQTSLASCICQQGYVWNPTTLLCDSCPPGTFNNQANESQCFTCVTVC
ncbi:MAG: hypothetical protein EBR09_14995 [Proteobacteria bacterium]|nr:hypothetical protein [Pseudomonadota bacterium]